MQVRIPRRRFLAIALVSPLVACSYSREQAENDAKKAADVGKSAVGTVKDALSDEIIIDTSPVPIERVTATNWYGNTELAFQKRDDWYAELQGFHSGIDWLVPVGTQVTAGLSRPGQVISVNGSPYNWKAAPNAVAVEVGPYIVLYGHLSKPLVGVGDPVDRNTIVGLSGIGQGTAHLHVEFIRRDPDERDGRRPADVRTNPAPHILAEVRDQIEAKSGAFHLNSGNRWLTPLEQPDIVPGNKLFFP